MCPCFPNIDTLQSESTTEQLLQGKLFRGCTIYLGKLHGNLWTPQDHKDTKEDRNLL